MEMENINSEENILKKDLISNLKSFLEESSKEDIEKLISLIGNNDDISKEEISLERPFDMLYLPSKGFFYKNKIDYLILRNLSYEEENVLTSEFLFKSGKSLEYIYKNLCINIADISFEDILYGDMEAICLFLRSSAYGDVIKMPLQCQNCGKNNDDVSIQLSSFRMKECDSVPDNEGFISFIVKNVVFKIKPPTFKQFFDWERNNLSEIEKRADIVFSINNNTNRTFILNTIKGMAIQDARELKKFIDKNMPGVDAKFVHNCESCESDSNYDFGLGYKFLELPYSFKNTILEEIFLLFYYGKGIDVGAAKKMSVYERRWFLNRINEEITKQREAEDKETRKINSQAKSTRKR